MVLMHIIIPAAGRMRLNTSQSGICSTKRSNALSVSKFTRMLVPNPKKAFQSPGTQSNGLPLSDGSEDFEPAVVVMTWAPSFRVPYAWRCALRVAFRPIRDAVPDRSRLPANGGRSGRHRLQDSRRVSDPAEDP